MVPIAGSGCPDDLSRHLTEEDVRVLLDLLKLAVAQRAGPDAVQALSQVLAGALWVTASQGIAHLHD